MSNDNIFHFAKRGEPGRKREPLSITIEATAEGNVSYSTSRPADVIELMGIMEVVKLELWAGPDQDNFETEGGA